MISKIVDSITLVVILFEIFRRVKGTRFSPLYKTETHVIWVNVNDSDQPLGIRKVRKLLGHRIREEERWASVHYVL